MQFVNLLIIIYFLSSLFFYFFPHLIHKKKQCFNKFEKIGLERENKILLIAHRGGSREKIENTIPAFENAIK